MLNTSHCKETYGRLGRRRTYPCTECKLKFQVETLNPLPEIERVCPECKKHTYVYTFINSKSGKEVQIRASDAELATLRAWEKNKNLTFKR